MISNSSCLNLSETNQGFSQQCTRWPASQHAADWLQLAETQCSCGNISLRHFPLREDVQNWATSLRSFLMCSLQIWITEFWHILRELHQQQKKKVITFVIDIHFSLDWSLCMSVLTIRNKCLCLSSGHWHCNLNSFCYSHMNSPNWSHARLTPTGSGCHTI